MTTGRSIVALTLSITLCLLAGAAGGWATATSVRTWYPLLDKPAWTPPDALFGPVWTLLYVLMGVSVWLFWRKTGWAAGRGGIALFVIQLLLNALWSFLFFGLQSPGWGALGIVVLWVAIVTTMVAFWRHHRLAAGLLVPYLLWVSYATALNLSIWARNPV